MWELFIDRGGTSTDCIGVDPETGEVRVAKVLSGDRAPIEGARVLATLDDDEASPLLVERSYDRGRVVLWTTSIDPEWARVAESPNTLVPLVHELVRWAATPAEGSPNLTAGAPWIAEVDSFPQNAFVVRPDGSRRPLEGEPQAVGPGRVDGDQHEVGLDLATRPFRAGAGKQREARQQPGDPA